MGFPRIICVVILVLLNTSVLCNGGITSTFVRKVEKTIDMPFDSDVFSVPPGYNAPQQTIAKMAGGAVLTTIFGSALGFCLDKVWDDVKFKQEFEELRKRQMLILDRLPPIEEPVGGGTEPAVPTVGGAEPAAPAVGGAEPGATAVWGW